jgi:hypothetical protein
MKRSGCGKRKPDLTKAFLTNTVRRYCGCIDYETRGESTTTSKLCQGQTVARWQNKTRPPSQIYPAYCTMQDMVDSRRLLVTDTTLMLGGDTTETLYTMMN